MDYVSQKMGNRLLQLAGIVLVLTSAGSVWAQRPSNGFYLTSPLSLSAGYDDNFIVNSKPLDDTVSILTAPTLLWINTTRRAKFAVDYQPEFQIYARFPDLNAWNHAASLHYVYRINPRLDFQAGDSFMSTSDATPGLGDSQFLPPRGLFRQNAVFAGLNFRLAPQTKLNVRFDNAVTALSVPGPDANRFDQMASAGTVSLDHTVNRHNSVTGSYGYLRVRPLDRNGSGAFPDQELHTVSAGYAYTVNSGLIFRAAGGVIRGPQLSYTAGGVVEKQMGGIWVMAGYQRYLSFFGGFTPSAGVAAGSPAFANGLLPDSLFQAVTLRVRGQLTRRMGVELNGQRGRVSIGDRGVRSLVAQSRLDYKLNERFTVFARAEYYGQNLSQFVESPLSRRRYFGGLEITLSRPPEAEGAAGGRGITPPDFAGPQEDDPGVPEGK